MKRYVIKVTGKVQGVFFRDTARQVATRLGLTGFAHNEPDGSVHIEVEGDESKLQAFVQWCRTGSPYARVETVEYSPKEVAGHIGFDIR
jgi:acylphosphatase